MCFSVKMGYSVEERAPVLMDLLPGLQAAAAQAEVGTVELAKAEKDKLLFNGCKNKHHIATAAMAKESVKTDLHTWYHNSKPVSDYLNRTRKKLKGSIAVLKH